MLTYWWVPVIALITVFQAYITIRSNVDGGIWIYILMLSTINPTWALITRTSKDIILDGFIYDIVTSIAYAVAILYFSQSLHRFSTAQYAGMVIIIIGMLLFKRGI